MKKSEILNLLFIVLVYFPDIIYNLNISFMKSQQGRQNNFSVKQFLGHDGGLRGVSFEDYISVLKFNQNGSELAAADFAGRVIIFRKTLPSKQKKSQKYQYCHQFQSHTPKFDIFRSQEIPQKINDICWLKSQGKYSKLLTVNSNEIKLWKYFEHQDRVPIKSSGPQLFIPKMCTIQTSYTERHQNSFFLNSKESFHSLLIQKNQEYIFAATENKVLMWSLQKSKQPFIYVDSCKYRSQSAPTIQNYQDTVGGMRIKAGYKKKLSLDLHEQQNYSQSEKLTSIASHPNNDNVIATSNSKGVIKLNDTRSPRFQSIALLDAKSKSKKNFFSELTAPISKISFFEQGKYIVSRDFLTVKIWDLCQTDEPIIKINLNEGMIANLSQIFERDLFGDTFPLAISKSKNCICTGYYDNKIHMLDWTGNICQNAITNKQYTIQKQQKTIVQQIIGSQKQPSHPNYQKNIQSIDFHPSNNTVAMSHKNCIYILAKK